ncbi:hypothetical protein L3X37_04660 [Sabulilitoribacter arenilitoris]|uniref:Uncharacterized protein n=1 Tax=Wocania arenilitoris TaxID=2044858 RepID=A0AAE3EMD1_9FLAO|nr:hypothetical protein [Wocania arenilitoris]MCF7567656.1 hypothetical protein [Wocania arenilitoris]
MKTIIKFVSIIIFCLTTCLRCSKDSPIPCGTITEITEVYYGWGLLLDLTVQMSDGSNRFDRVDPSDVNLKVGDEYCEATRTTP